MAPSTPYISLFSGVGGLDLGLRIACPSARCVCYCEREITAAERLVARIEEGSLDAAPIWSDVATFDGLELRGRFRGLGVVGGFPCQDLSLAGARAGINAGARSGLWWEYLRIIRDSGASWAFIENVPGLLCSPGIDDVESGESADGGATDWPFRNIDAVLGPLSELGFDAEWCSISAADVGASHGRRRVFILAYRAGSRRGGDAGQHDGRPPSLPSRPSEHGRSMAYGDVNRGELPRSTERTIPGPDGQSPAKVRPSGGTMAEPASSGLPIRGDDSGLRQPEAVERSGSAMEHPAHATGERFQQQREHVPGTADSELGDPDSQSGSPRHGHEPGEWAASSQEHGTEHRTTSRELGDPESGGRGERREPSGGVGLVDGAVEELGHSESDDGSVLQPAGRQHDTDRTGASGGLARARLGIFAPGPTNPIWQNVLVQRSWMRPSLSQAEIEPVICHLADGLADLVAHERTAALRGAGNGVVSLQAAVAFTILARRAGLFGF